MKSLLIRFFTIVLALFIADEYVRGISVDDFYTAVIVTILLVLLNTVVRPILLVLTIPITILTFGLFVFVLNAGLFWFVGSFVDGFWVDGFIPALVGSVVVSTLRWLVQKLT